MIAQKAAATTTGRQMFYYEVVPTWDVVEGGPSRREILRRDEPLASANYVSSVDAAGLHHPALNISVPIVLVPQENAAPARLWVDTRCSQRAYRNLLRVLAEFRITDVSSRRALSKKKSVECYAMDVRNTQAPRSLTDYMVENYTTFGGSFDELLCVGAEATRPSRAEFVTGPTMKHPRLLSLAVDAYLVQSATNCHLYLDTTLSWEGYCRILEALRKAHVLDKTWLKTSLHYGSTDLRAPWVRRDCK